MKWRALEAIEILVRAWQLRRTELKPIDNMWEQHTENRSRWLSRLARKKQ